MLLNDTPDRQTSGPLVMGSLKTYQLGSLLAFLLIAVFPEPSCADPLWHHTVESVSVQAALLIPQLASELAAIIVVATTSSSVQLAAEGPS